MEKQILGTAFIQWMPEVRDGMSRCYFPLPGKKAMEIAGIEFENVYDGRGENEIGSYPSFVQVTKATPKEIVKRLKEGAFKDYVEAQGGEWHPVTDEEWREVERTAYKTYPLK